MKVDETIYLKTLGDSLEKICFDRSSGETYDFVNLFYPLDIEVGKFAFQSYSKQMDKVHELSDTKIVSYNRTSQLKKATFNTIHTTIRQAMERLEKKNWCEQENNFEEQVGVGEVVDNENKTKVDRNHDKIKNQNFKLQAKKITDVERKLEVSADVDLLFEEEEDINHSSLILDEKEGLSRVLAIASAGYGKTTLLRRIALYYCDPTNKKISDKIKYFENKKEFSIGAKYSLTGHYIPCIIRLRDINDNDFSIIKAIESSIISVFKSHNMKANFEIAINESDILQWINSVRSSLLLLIDGLDELSDGMRLDFLLSLENYLQTTPETHIIMTSRVAGLSEYGVKDMLRKMRFRGRSIIPLTEDGAKEYSKKWIRVTQQEEQHTQLLGVLEQVMNQKRFNHLKEFTRKPLELLIILKQIANGTLSLNHYQMFHDMLWEQFTSHVKRYDKKRLIFEDTMTFLSFLAYKMQLKDSLYISQKEIEEVLDELGNLSFHTDILGMGKAEDYLAFLENLAANVGIIEKDDRANKVYTFPIRANQEFLTAYACCHLRLLPGSFKPTPQKLIKEHMFDTRWIGIINFILSDLGSNSQMEFDQILKTIFADVTDLEHLRAIVEFDLIITRGHAHVLCDNVFSSERLDNNRKKLLVACLNSQSAYAYVDALKVSYFNQKESDNYLEASAIASVVWDYNSGHSAFETALNALQSGNVRGARQGALIISILATTCFDEGCCEILGESICDDLKNKIASDFVVNETLLYQLNYNARNLRDVYSVIALTNLWLTKMNGTKTISSILTVDLANIVITTLNDKHHAIRRFCVTDKNGYNESEYSEIKELLHALGTFPIKANNELLTHKEENVFVSAFIQTMYEKSRYDEEVDQVAIATACLYYCWDINRFTEAWGAEICRGMPSEYVRKDLSSKREQNHFELVRDSLIDFEKTYAQQQAKNINTLTSTNNVFALFRSGQLLEAARVCAKNADGVLSNYTNLAFLIRYGKLNGAEIIEDQIFSIPDLLELGVSQKDSYALMNMALYEISNGKILDAIELLRQISPQGWEDISSSFWYPELWVTKRDPEGALVCVLAHIFSKCKFHEYNDMLESVIENYSLLYEQIIK